MIDISISAVQQKVIREAYYKRLTDWITKKKLWSRTGNARANKMMRYVRTYSKYYFLSPADQLFLRSGDFDRVYANEKAEYDSKTGIAKKRTSYGRFVSRMREIYNGFMQDENDTGVKNGYWLMKELGIKVCPYCNRNYTVTIHTKDVKVRPEFDHFYPEALHPVLILSFYNLVPSCPQCNHLKKVQVLEVNPWKGYKTGARPKFRVDTSKEDFPANPVINIENSNVNTDKLGIRELYNEHSDYVKDILDKIQAYNPVIYHAIARDFQGVVHTEADLERMVWGNYTQELDAGKRPLAKLTADILEQYKKYL